MITIEEAQELYEEVSSHEIRSIKTLEWWMAGMVFSIETELTGNIVFKLYKKAWEREETVDDRIYGSNYLNLRAAHKLLVDNNILTFELLETWVVKSYRYALFTLLEGREPDWEIIKQEIYVETLANIHSLTREYQGWVCNKEPYKLSWRDAFQESIYSRLSDVEDILDDKIYEKIKEYIDNHIALLENPKSYVLSHLDGLQAIFLQANGLWSLRGVIDVEDYQFTDQRFVMAGITLWELLGRYKLPKDFLEIYQSKTTLDSSFKDFEVLFQVYYLLVWIKVLNNCKMLDEEGKCNDALKNIFSN